MAKFIVTGGAGFIGSNTSRRILERGDRLVIVDNLSRKGAASNLEWLREAGDFALIEADMRDAGAMERLFVDHGDAEVVIHLAGQVAVTTSVANPREDFDVNAGGSLNLLEGARLAGVRPLMIYASTNKVYGGLEHLRIDEHATRYAYRDYPEGIPETMGLDFHSPYGCSKGAADQYFHDYGRIYGIPTVVMRQSCIYGPRQFGLEDQGWLAWFMIATLTGKPITIYGDGKQVRDVLFVDDLVDAYFAAVAQVEKAAGQIFNVGGGPRFTLSIWQEFCPILERLLDGPVEVGRGKARPGDQPVYVSDIRKIDAELGWKPRTSPEEGLRILYDWVALNLHLFK